jgi:hypothetical protein
MNQTAGGKFALQTYDGAFGRRRCRMASPVRVCNVPRVTVRAEFNGREETLSEYMCDWPDCPNVAVEVVTFVRELRTCTVMCAEHAAQQAKQARAKNDTTS